MMIEKVKSIFAGAIMENNPQTLARGTQLFLETSGAYIEENRWELLETLCISVDSLLADARKSKQFDATSMQLLTDLTQQIIAVVQFVAHAQGDRTSGNFIAAQRQAKRLDTMTGSQLQLLALTEKVQSNGAAPNITLTF